MLDAPLKAEKEDASLAELMTGCSELVTVQPTGNAEQQIS